MSSLLSQHTKRQLFLVLFCVFSLGNCVCVLMGVKHIVIKDLPLVVALLHLWVKLYVVFLLGLATPTSNHIDYAYDFYPEAKVGKPCADWSECCFTDLVSP